MIFKNLVISFALVASPFASALASSAGQSATNAASEWLSDVYRGHYAESWESLSPELKSKYTPESWSSHLAAMRSGLGSPIRTKVGGYDPDAAAAIETSGVILRTEGEYINGSKSSGSITMIRGLTGWVVGSYVVTRATDQ